MTLSKRLLSRAQLLEIMNLISNPKRHALTEEGLDQAIENFCAGCPDPVQADSLITENPDPMTDEEIVDRALSMTCRQMSSVPTTIVSANHPARAMDN
jgi:hypothetical protein